MIPDTKICGDCKIEKGQIEFPRRKKGDYVWLRLQCYACMRERSKIRYIKNRQKIIDRNKIYSDRNKGKVYKKQQLWRTLNPERQKSNKRKRYLENCEEIKKRRKEYYYNNKEKCIQSVTNYQQRNLSIVRQKQRLLHKKKKAENISYSILKTLRSRVNMAIKKKGVKCSKTRELIGCSMQFLLTYLESKFKDGMNWGNQGVHGWHIDHIKPCAKFDLTKLEEQKKCFHYSNLQPLWAIDNIKKSDTWE